MRHLPIKEYLRIKEIRHNATGRFSNEKEVIAAFNNEAVTLHTMIKLRLKTGEIVDTTVGRSILYDILPEGADFALLNNIIHLLHNNLED